MTSDYRAWLLGLLADGTWTPAELRCQLGLSSTSFYDLLRSLREAGYPLTRHEDGSLGLRPGTSGLLAFPQDGQVDLLEAVREAVRRAGQATGPVRLRFGGIELVVSQHALVEGVLAHWWAAVRQTRLHERV